MSHIKVEEDKTLVRDSTTGAILNTDREALQNYRRRKSILDGQQKRIDNLENTVAELKELLNTIINKE
jgi:predicted transcriptional regulator